MAPTHEFNPDIDGTAAAMSAAVTGQMLPPGAGAGAVGAAMPPPMPSQPGYVGPESDYGRQIGQQVYQQVAQQGGSPAVMQQRWTAEMQRQLPGVDLRYLMPGYGEQTRQAGPIPAGAANALRDQQLAPDAGAYFRHLDQTNAPVGQRSPSKPEPYQDTSVLAPTDQPFAGVGRQQELDEARQAQNQKDLAAANWLEQHGDTLDFMETHQVADHIAAKGGEGLTPELLQNVRQVRELQRLHEEGLANAQSAGTEAKNIAVQGLAGIGRKAAGAVDLAGDFVDSSALGAVMGGMGGPTSGQAGSGAHALADEMRQYYRDVQQNHPIYGKLDKFMASLPETVASTTALLANPAAGGAIFGADAALSKHEETLDRLKQAVDAGQISSDDAHQAARTLAAVAGGSSLITQRLIGPNATGTRLAQSVKAAGDLGGQSLVDNLTNQTINRGVFGDPISIGDAVKGAAAGAGLGLALHNLIFYKRDALAGSTPARTLDDWQKVAADAHLPPSAAMTLRKLDLARQGHAAGEAPEDVNDALNRRWTPQDDANVKAMEGAYQRGVLGGSPEPAALPGKYGTQSRPSKTNEVFGQPVLPGSADAAPGEKRGIIGGDAPAASVGGEEPHGQQATPDSAAGTGQGGAGDLAATTNPHPVAAAPAPPRTDTAEHHAVLAEQFPLAHSIEPFDGGFIVHHDDPAAASPRAPSYVLYTADPEAEIQSRKSNKLTPGERFETWWASIQKYAGQRFADADGQPFTLPSKPEELTEPQRRMIEQMTPSAVNVGDTIYMSPRAGVNTLRHEIVHNKMARLRRLDPEGYQRLIAPFKTDGKGDLEAEETGAESLASHPDLIEPPRGPTPPTPPTDNTPSATAAGLTEPAPEDAKLNTPGVSTEPLGKSDINPSTDTTPSVATPAPSQEGRPPVPLPPLHEEIRPSIIQPAWDVVSAQYPDLATQVTRIEPLPYTGPVRDSASYNPRTGVLRINPDQQISAEHLGHEFMHVEQGVNGQPTSAGEYDTDQAWDKAVEQPARDRGAQFAHHDPLPPYTPPAAAPVQSGTPPAPATAGAAGSVEPSPQPSPGVPEEKNDAPDITPSAAPTQTRYTTIPDNWLGLPLHQSPGTGIFSEKNAPVSTRSGSRARFWPEWRSQLIRIGADETAKVEAVRKLTKEVFPVSGRGGKGFLVPKDALAEATASMAAAPPAAAKPAKAPPTPEQAAEKLARRASQRSGIVDRLRELYSQGASFNGLNMDALSAQRKWPDKEVMAWAAQQPEDSEPYLLSYLHGLAADDPRGTHYQMVRPATLEDGTQIKVGKETLTVRHDEAEGRTFLEDGITAEVRHDQQVPARSVEQPAEAAEIDPASIEFGDPPTPEPQGAGFFDADKAGVSAEKPGLFGQPVFDRNTGEQSSMFDTSKPAEPARVGSKSATDPRHTPTMFPPSPSPGKRVAGWPADFPRVVTHVPAATLQAADGYQAAIAGDRPAARKVVHALADRAQLDQLGHQFPGALVVYPHAQEAAGINQLPAAYAAAVADVAGLKVGPPIVQTNVVAGTKLGAIARLANPPEFSGSIQAGANYILADDVAGTGSTLNALRKHVESKGGKVVAATTLAAAEPQGQLDPRQLSLRPQTLEELRNKFDAAGLDATLRSHGVAESAADLTDPEARILLRAGTLDAIRSRFAEARRPGGEPVLQGPVQEPAAQPGGQPPQRAAADQPRAIEPGSDRGGPQPQPPLTAQGGPPAAPGAGEPHPAAQSSRRGPDDSRTTPIDQLRAATSALIQMDAPSLPPTKPRIRPDALPGGDVKQLRDIIFDAGKSLDKPVRIGQTHKKGVLGSYFAGSTKTLIKFHGDLNTTAHEIGHLIDDRTSLVGQYFTGRAPFDDELIPDFSGHGSTQGKTGSTLPYQRAEGVAEWIRAWLINPAEAQAAAPKFFAHFKATVPAETVTKLRAFGDDIRKWAGLPAHQQVAANIRELGAVKTWTGRLAESLGLSSGDGGTFQMGFRDKIQTALSDALHPVFKAIDAASELRDDLGPALPEHDAKVLMRLLPGHAGKFEEMMEHGLRDWSLAPVKDSGKPVNVDYLFEPLDRSSSAALARDARDAAAMMVSERVLEKASQLLAAAEDQIRAAVPPTQTMAQAMADPKFAKWAGNVRKAAVNKASNLAGFGGGVYSDIDMATHALAELVRDPARKARLEEAVKRYRTFANTVLEYARDGGWLSPEAFTKIKDANQFYAAMHRVMEEIAPTLRPSGGTKQLGTMASIIQRFKGSRRQMENPYVNLLEQAHRIYHEVDRNAAKNAFADLLRSGRGMYEGGPRDLDPIGSKAEAGDPDTIKIKNKGEVEHWQFQKDVYKALKNWGEVDSPNLIEKLLQLPRKITTFAVVHAPPFMVRHAGRLMMHSSVISQAGMNPSDMLRRTTPQMKSDFRASGADQSGELPHTKDDYHKLITGKVKELAKDRSTVVAIAKGAANLYGHAVHLSDRLARLSGEYRRSYNAAKAAGLSEKNAILKAGAAARELMDYAVAGTTTAKIGKYVPFIRARVRGIAKTWAAAFGGKGSGQPGAGGGQGARARRFWRNFGTYIVAPTLAVYALNKLLGHDKEEKQMPAWRRDFFWNFKVGHLWLSIPRPYELGVAASGITRMIDYASGDKHAFDGYAGSNARANLPFDVATAEGPFAALMESLANWSPFFGKHIIPPGDEGKDPSLRSGARHASRLAKALRDVVGWAGFEADPRKIDYVLHATLGGTAQLATDLSDIGRSDRQPERFLGDATGLTTSPPAYTARDVQWVMTEAERLGDSQSKPMRQFHAALDLQASSKTIAERDQKAAEIRDQAGKLREFYEKWGPAILQVKQASQAAREITGARDDVKLANPKGMAAYVQDHGDELRWAAQVQKAAARFTQAKTALEDARDGMTPADRKGIEEDMKRIVAAIPPQPPPAQVK